MAAQQIDRSRRAFLTGRRAARPHALRPPWTVLADKFADACTGCGACIAACPESVLYLDGDRLAAIDFRRGTGLCSFCGTCAKVCPAPAFLMESDRTAVPPWTLRAVIGDSCMTRSGVMCQSCKDACGDAAISFAYGASRVAQPTIDLSCCTGCGACVAPCPADAITVLDQEAVHA